MRGRWRRWRGMLRDLAAIEDAEAAARFPARNIKAPASAAPERDVEAMRSALARKLEALGEDAGRPRRRVRIAASPFPAQQPSRARRLNFPPRSVLVRPP